ncbi:hypothetical protein K490DRAFT_53547 [Saccharata proteae CBS 121410]|uniref:Uncharacterized protein n=1 Tax=Saccharata proteae CBS 121410 TaxID=1314787 RepID=A0A9P4HZT6_9PEZI|nr:hypothetical protein K490DRAFT_53547 [Saccharata proteae CBS 121410]
MFTPAPFRRLSLRLASLQPTRTIRTRPRPSAPSKPSAQRTDDYAEHERPLTDAQRKFLEDKFSHVLKDPSNYDDNAEPKEGGEENQIDPVYEKILEKDFKPSYDMDRPIEQPPWMNFYTLDTNEIGLKAPRPEPRLQGAITMRQILDLEKSIREKIARTEEELVRIQNDDFSMTPEVVKYFGGDAEKLKQLQPPELLSDADPEKVERELAALRITWPKDGDVIEKSEPAIQTLNNCLRNAYLATDPALRPLVRQELWKAYKRAKMAVPDVITAIPNSAWDMLFYVQASKFQKRHLTDGHTEELLDDMKKVGIEDGPPSKVEEIRQKSLEEWEEKMLKIDEEAREAREEQEEEIRGIEEEKDFFQSWKPEPVRKAEGSEGEMKAVEVKKPEVKKRRSPFQTRLKQKRNKQKGKEGSEGNEGND